MGRDQDRQDDVVDLLQQAWSRAGEGRVDLGRVEPVSDGELRGLLCDCPKPDGSDHQHRTGYLAAVQEATLLYGDRWNPAMT